MRELEAARALLEHGARVNVVDKQGRTPLQVASSEKYPNTDIIRLLSERGAK